jgi:hypothetical protein
MFMTASTQGTAEPHETRQNCRSFASTLASDSCTMVVDDRPPCIELRKEGHAVWHALGDSGTAQRIIKTQYKRGYRFTVNVSTRSSHSAAAGRGMPKQDIQSCASSDGTRIAYACAGSGSPIVKTGNWMNHLEYDWESPVWSHLLRSLAGGRELVHCDARADAGAALPRRRDPAHH